MTSVAPVKIDSDVDSDPEDMGEREMCPPPPPPAYEEPGEAEAPSMQFGSAAKITSDEVREAVLEFVAEHCCYGKGAAEKMIFNQILPSNALHYMLETFCEGRRTGHNYTPYHGGPVDSRHNGTPPAAWAMHCEAQGHFTDQEYVIKIPHTEDVRMCQRCLGCGQVQCSRCNGRGQNRCGPCGGDGRVYRTHEGESYHERCGACGGDGWRRCSRCGGDGRIRCPRCVGSGKLKYFMELTVTFTNHINNFVLEETAMPDELVTRVAGVELFAQTRQYVHPIRSFPVQVINDNSVRLIEQSSTAFNNERRINQRQTLRAVPVTEAHYLFTDWKNKVYNTRLWVYGMERKVHSPDYPYRCCWGCNVL